MNCKHEDFRVNAKVARLEDSGRFMVELAVKCHQCGKPFQWRGLQPGLDTDGARVSLDGLEANIAIVPQGMEPTPFDGITGLDITGQRRN